MAGPAPGTSDDPDAVAAAAAETSGVEVVDVHDTAGFGAVASVLDEVWGRPEGSGAVLGREALAAIAHAGGQVSTAVRGGRVVGVTAAFLGRAEDGSTFLHSHVTGVRGDAAGTGVGSALKWHQRAWCLRRDLREVRWTFDPLVRRNTVFNLVRLGAQAGTYLEDAYGPMADTRNVGLPTDRLVARWVLDAPRVVAAARGRAAEPDLDALRRTGAEVALEEAADGSPHLIMTRAPRRLVRVPADIEALRARDEDLARAWVAAIRTALADGLRTGRISGATRDGWIVVTDGAGTTDLRGRGP